MAHAQGCLQGSHAVGYAFLAAGSDKGLCGISSSRPHMQAWQQADVAPTLQLSLSAPVLKTWVLLSGSRCSLLDSFKCDGAPVQGPAAWLLVGHCLANLVAQTALHAERPTGNLPAPLSNPTMLL